MNNDDQSYKLMQFSQKPVNVFRASIWGKLPPGPWFCLLYSGLVFEPTAFGFATKATPLDVFHLTGLLVLVVSVICMGEEVRVDSYLNTLLGLAVAVGALNCRQQQPGT